MASDIHRPKESRGAGKVINVQYVQSPNGRKPRYYLYLRCTFVTHIRVISDPTSKLLDFIICIIILLSNIVFWP